MLQECCVLSSTLGEEVGSRAVSPHVEVFVEALALLESQLCQVVSAIVSEQQESSRFQIFEALLSDVLESGNRAQ